MNSKNTMSRWVLLSLVAALAVPTLASAQEDGEPTEVVVHDRERGELSPGAQAPTREEMMNGIQTASTEGLIALLEYGERVECHACVPLLERNLLESEDPEVRRISAWWLRHCPFAIPAIMNRMVTALESDSSPVRRARAARAIGEFLDPNGLEPLTDAFDREGESVVREAVVRALGRLNHPGGNAVLGQALADTNVEVRRAAIDQVLKVNFFREHDALLGALGDDDTMVRMRAARIVGQMRLAESVPALAALLRGDESLRVRQAAAWALGHIGGADARGALREAMTTETESLVLDALEVALLM